MRQFTESEMSEIEKINPNARGIFEDAYVMGWQDGLSAIEDGSDDSLEDFVQMATDSYFKIKNDGSID